MPYIDVAQMAIVSSLNGRITACSAQEGEVNPPEWTAQHIWTVCGAPGWDTAWASAMAGGMNPEVAGADAGVITDGMILSSVQSVRGAAT